MGAPRTVATEWADATAAWLREWADALVAVAQDRHAHRTAGQLRTVAVALPRDTRTLATLDDQLSRAGVPAGRTTRGDWPGARTECVAEYDLPARVALLVTDRDRLAEALTQAHADLAQARVLMQEAAA